MFPKIFAAVALLSLMICDLVRPLAAETLAHHLTTNALGHASGLTPNPDVLKVLENWSYNNYSNANLHFITNSVWSTNFWLHGVQGLSATCIGFSNGVGGQGLITMVSPRHYLFATHMHPEGYLVPFLDTNNVIFWRKTLERVDVADDTSVGILNADLPSSVGFLPVLPTNFSNYLPKDRSAIQGLGMNQGMLIFSQPMLLINTNVIAWNSQIPVPSGLGTNWSMSLHAGDSSDPDMLLIHHQLVLVSHNTGITAGPNYAHGFDAINRAMHHLSTHNHVKSDYQLTPISLTNWDIVP